MAYGYFGTMRDLDGHAEVYPVRALRSVLRDLEDWGADLLAVKGDVTAAAGLEQWELFSDLVGEIDPIKVAEGRYLADESTIHFGLIPRTNRGILAINELPDLAERIQVGLLNLLEERDVQVRGHTLRLPLDLMFVAPANPEDYTSRGRIITPLTDRLGSQVRTTRSLHKDGRMLYVDMSFGLVADATGNIVGALAVARDGTSRYLEKQALQEKLAAAATNTAAQ